VLARLGGGVVSAKTRQFRGAWACYAETVSVRAVLAATVAYPLRRAIAVADARISPEVEAKPTEDALHTPAAASSRPCSSIKRCQRSPSGVLRQVKSSKLIFALSASMAASLGMARVL
jgi:hypothetical protein